MHEVTELLNAICGGDQVASAELLPLVYAELRKLAALKLSEEKPGQTLQATALVHEAYVRLVQNQGDPSWNGRGHFFCAAAEAMRRILVESARRKRRVRHGGLLQRVEFNEEARVTADGNIDLLALDELLGKLASEEPQAAEVIKLRYFAGLTIEETADALQLSVRTVNRHWAFGRAWLYQRLK